MRKLVTIPCAAILLALPMLALPVLAVAQDKNPARPGALPPALTAEAFDALTQGRIMGHTVHGSWYGAEQYLPGRRVIWKDPEGCMHGTWRPEGPLICFDYSDGQPDRCWHYFKDGEGIGAIFNGDPDEPTVLLREEAPPLTCPDEGLNA